jgi:ribonucleoside-triphosphate reductase
MTLQLPSMQERIKREYTMESKSGKRIPVEVYSRVVGYYRPVNYWNRGKQEEFHDRKEYVLIRKKNERIA